MAVANDAINEIKRLIISGRFGPGDKLPKEQELASQLGLSRSSLREAVRALILLGVLSARQGDGTYVTSLEPHLLLRSTGFVADLLGGGNGLLELLEIRRMLEPAATAMAAPRIGAEDLRRLRECMERMDLASRVEDLVEADDEFHGIIAAACGNATLASLIEGLSGRTLRARVWRGITDAGAVERTRRGHHTIYRALEIGDPEFARAAATAHVVEVEFWFLGKLEPEIGAASGDGAPALDGGAA